MSSAPEGSDGEIFDRFLTNRGHDTGPVDWERSYNKKQCPECGGLHEEAASECSVCGWTPTPG